MQIDALEPGCVRISLTAEEADAYQLGSSRMEESDPAVRRFLREMLREAAACTDALSHAGRLLAQAYTARDGSITLYLTALGCGESAHEPFMYRFRSADEAVAALRGLFALHCHRVLSSSLYRMRGRFYAAVRAVADEGAVAGYLSEYGEAAGRGALRLAFLEEHAEPVILDNAMDVVTYYFS